MGTSVDSCLMPSNGKSLFCPHGQTLQWIFCQVILIGFLEFSCKIQNPVPYSEFTELAFMHKMLDFLGFLSFLNFSRLKR